MNLRLDPAGIRFRLTQAEALQLEATGRVEAPLPSVWGGPSRMAVEVEADGKTLSLDPKGDCLTLRVPAPLLKGLTGLRPPKEGVSAPLRAAAPAPLTLTLEVDVRKR